MTAVVNGEDRISYMGWDENRVVNNGVMTTSIDCTGDCVFSVEDSDGNIGTCSASVGSYSLIASEEKSCTSSNWGNKKSGHMIRFLVCIS